MMIDIQDYHRRLTLATYFEGKRKKERLPFTANSNWTPNLGSLPSPIRSLIQADLYAIKKS